MIRLVFEIDCGEYNCGECEHLLGEDNDPRCTLFHEFLDAERDEGEDEDDDGAEVTEVYRCDQCQEAEEKDSEQQSKGSNSTDRAGEGAC